MSKSLASLERATSLAAACDVPEAKLTVTLDSNTLAAVVSPETAQGGWGPDAAAVRAAIEDGRVRAFFSETHITLEGIQGKSRADTLGKTRMVSRSESTGPQHITLTIGLEHHRDPLDPRFLERVTTARRLGIWPLRTAARLCFHHLPPEELYAPPGGIDALVKCMEMVNALTNEICKRGVGYARAVELGKRFVQIDPLRPVLWMTGLAHANPSDVRSAIAEWSDGDGIGAHYGFGMELFCTQDEGRSSGQSVLNSANRRWLSEDYGIRFVTLAGLRTILAGTTPPLARGV
jgi:hypothetical protein